MKRGEYENNDGILLARALLQSARLLSFARSAPTTQLSTNNKSATNNNNKECTSTFKLFLSPQNAYCTPPNITQQCLFSVTELVSILHLKYLEGQIPEDPAVIADSNSTSNGDNISGMNGCFFNWSIISRHFSHWAIISKHLSERPNS